MTATKAFVLDFYRRVWTERQPDEARRFIGVDYLDHNAPPGLPRGPEVFAAHMQGIFTTFPDFRLTVHECIAENDWVATRVTAEGTHAGVWMGIVPTGRRISLRGLNLDRVANGRIVEHWGEADTVGMLVQMGADPFGQRQGTP